MTCVVCGAIMTTQRETYRYRESGLAQVLLRDVEVSRCPQCGEMEVAILQIEALHQAIAHALLHKPTRLTAEEIAYLRRVLAWSGTELAAYLGTTPETVSRWEHGATPMGKTAERLLRLVVATRLPGCRDVLEALRGITQTMPSHSLRVSLRWESGGWQVAAPELTLAQE